jgi:hypothetical protein
VRCKRPPQPFGRVHRSSLITALPIFSCVAPM